MKNKYPRKKSRLFNLGLVCICIAAGLQIAQIVGDKLNPKPIKATPTQEYQIPADRPIIIDFNQKR
jgi:uncharacterized membrane protein